MLRSGILCVKYLVKKISQTKQFGLFVVQDWINESPSLKFLNAEIFLGLNKSLHAGRLIIIPGYFF